MLRAERDYRLNMVREEMAALEEEGRKLADTLEKEQAEAEAARRVREKAKRERGAFSRILDLVNPFGGLDEDFGMLGSVIQSSAAVHFAQGMKKRFEELQEEEAKLLGVKVDDPEPVVKKPNKDVRDDIFREIAELKKERAQRIGEITDNRDPQNWTDEDRDQAQMLRVIYDEKINKLMEQYSKSL